MSAVFELRQYTLKPGMRDTLISLFEREFIETQEAAGCDLPGQFRDVDVADRFVWLRGFEDMPSRAAALKAFYGGPVWKANREAANETMIDSDNVLLLRPGAAFALDGVARPAPGAPETPQGVVAATVCRFRDRLGDDIEILLARDVFPLFERAGTPVLAWFMTEYAPNNFSALPVREGENVVVWFARNPGVAPPLPENVLSQLVEYPLTLRLRPTARSKLRIAP